MERILEGYKEKGCRVTRSRGKNPNLLIIGEEHSHPLNNHVVPKKLFEEIKPQYFFCEVVRAGLEMDFTGYQNLHVDMSTPVRDESFEKLIQDTPFGGAGFAGLAITKWFSKSPETKFVGVGLAGETGRNDQLVKLINEAVERLDDYLAEMLHLRGHELTDEQYMQYEVFRDFLYEKKDSFSHVYEAVIKLEHIRKDAPRGVLDKAGLKPFFAKIKRDMERFNAERESTMGRTMVDYVSNASEVNLAVVGDYHIRRGSHIFPILDGSPVEYLSIDIRKRPVK